MNYLPLFDHLWQSTVFATAAGVLTLGLRRNRARVRHAVWLAASAKFLLPLSLLIALGHQIQPHLAVRPEPSTLAVAAVQVIEPFTAPVGIAAVQVEGRPALNLLPAILAAVWGCGFLGILCAWGIRWRRLRTKVASGTRIDLDVPIPAVVSPALMEPGVWGIVRPILLLPAGVFQRLTAAQMDTVIAHELEHVKHRDNLAAALHMFVETVFWFHPMVWWIGKRMLEERERACDEAVLLTGNQPRAYAEAVLTVCKLYVESPLACVSGIAGANLKKRIEAIMKAQIGGKLHFGKKLGLAAAAAIALAAPLLVGMMHAPAIWAQTPVAPAPQAPQAATAAPAVPSAPQVQTPAVQKSRPAAVIPVPVAPAVQAAVPQEPQITASTPAAEARQLRAVYAKAAFQNPMMVAAYTSYGPPNQKTRETIQGREVETWRYENVDLYKGSLTVEFSLSGARVLSPAQPRFEGGAMNAAAVKLLASVLAGGADVPDGSVRDGLPGSHVLVEPGLQVNRAEHFVNLLIPVLTMSGQVDVISQVTDEYKTVVANMRDTVDAKAGAWRGNVVLLPGAYACSVVVREQSSGLMYGETIAFRVAR